MKFFESVNPMVDWINKQVSWIDAEMQHPIVGNKQLNSRSVQLVSLEAFYQCLRDSDCTGSWKVWITPLKERGRINTVQAQKEQHVNPKVAAVLENYRILFNALEQLPPTRAITYQIKLFDEALLPPKRHQYRPL